MVMRNTIRGIFFVLLMLGIISTVFAINITTPPNNLTVANNVGEARSFEIVTNNPANVTWYINNSQIVSGINGITNVTISNYTNNSAGLGNWEIKAIAVNFSNPGDSATRIWTWIVSGGSTSGAPNITGTPSSPVTSYVGTSQAFNVNVNQTATINWTIDGTPYPLNTTFGTSSSYTNYSAGIGTYTVKANATNSNGSAENTWTWNVQASQGPAPVTGLAATSRGATWINWTWTNPGGNFNYTTVKINGTSQPNTSNNYFNFTQFNPGTLNTISLQTVDTFGIVNSTVVSNQTSTYNTPAGSNVIVTLTTGLVVTFDQVNTEGNTSAILYTTSQWGAHNFEKVGNYYDITTSSASSGNITIELAYSESGINESTVKLYHKSGTTWDDVTTSLDNASNKVRGNVTALSPFVVGVPPKPVISRLEPSSASLETIGTASQKFRVTIDQTTNVTWSITPGSSTPSVQVLANVETNITYTPPSARNYNVSVTATNMTSGSSSTTYWNWTVRPKTYETGNRIWDANKDMSLTYTWNPMSFYAFYYDVDNNVGSEKLTVSLNSRTDRTIAAGKLKYSTAPDSVAFKYETWGNYNVIGFMAEKYFAGYKGASGTTSKDITDRDISPLNNKQLHKILMDDDTKRAVYAGSTLTLMDGYVLKIKDVDITGGKIVLLSLLKDGGEVDTTAVSAGGTYVYTKRVGSVSDLPIIAIHIDTVFSGREANAAFLRGIFQIQEAFTSVNQGNRYSIMEIKSVSDTSITMENENSISLSPGSINDVMGDIKIIVADNSSVLRFAPMVQKSGTYEVRGTISQNNDTSFEWNPLNFEGFYYNINEDVGSEKLTSTRSGTSINEDNLVYSTSPQQVSFKYTIFGSYNVIGFMAEKYFAGYTSATSTQITSSPKSTLNSKQLHKVLIDDNTQRAVYAGSTLTLNDGYVLKVKDVDITGGKIVLLSLLKDGDEIDTTAVSAGSNYVYSKRVGVVSDLPIIVAHVETVFSGREANAAFMKGVFQISESFTTVNTGNRFGVMEVSEVSDTKIEMKNPSTVSLSPNSIVDVMGSIKFRVADSSDVRFYPFIMVTGSILAENQLVIDVPSSPMAKDTISINVTAGGGKPIENAEISYDGTSIGTTNSTGKIDYTLPKSGVHNITATKLGYEKAVKTIQVSEFVDNRLVFEIPPVFDQDIPVSIKVLANKTVISGANVTFDGQSIGTTDSNGILNYTFTVSGTHNLGASKSRYVSVLREVTIRTPFSEFKALSINITPLVATTGQQVLIRSNITNAGTKRDTLPVELIINNTVAENKSVTLSPGEIREINFTRKVRRLISPENETVPGNYTIEILGQKAVLQVKEEPFNILLIGGILTGLGAVLIYALTAKNKLSIDALKISFEQLINKAKSFRADDLKAGFERLINKVKKR